MTFSAFILIGGLSCCPQASVKNTYIINVKDDKVEDGPALNTRRQNLACEKVVIDTKTFIFAIGGYDRTAGSRLNSVEILEVGTNTWKTGKYQYNSTFLTK